MINALWCAAAGPEIRVAQLAYGGFKMPCDISEMLQRQYYFFGTYFVEEQILDRWREAAKGAKAMFDVGANAGIYSLATLASEPNAVVHAFEPTPEIAASLRGTQSSMDLRSCTFTRLPSQARMDMTLCPGAGVSIAPTRA
jgi:hypothetical protein